MLNDVHVASRGIISSERRQPALDIVLDHLPSFCELSRLSCVLWREPKIPLHLC